MASHLIVQISDVHLTSSGSLKNGARPRDNLAAALSLMESSGIAADVLLLTGDLTDAGDPSCYDDLAQLVDKAAAAIGSTVVYVPGNHDERTAFRRHLLGEIGSPEGDRPINQVVHRDGLRIVALDSVIPGRDEGELSEETLVFLRRALATPAPLGTVLTLHHPPISSPIELMARLALRQPSKLAEAIAGRDVRLICCGHNHHPATGMLAGVPVWVGPATAYRSDVASRQTFRGVQGTAFSRIDLDDSGPLITIVQVS